MIFVLYGQSGSGKTELGRKICEHIGTDLVIDGDEIRDIFSNKNYSKIGRQQNIRNAHNIATFLHHTTNKDVVVSLVSPYQELRQELCEANLSEVIQILLVTDRGLRKEYHVTEFEKGEPDYIINTNDQIEDTWEKLKKEVFSSWG
jgi:adenylylsulfate kinase-like enzyme